MRTLFVAEQGSVSDETGPSEVVMEFPLAGFLLRQAHPTVNGDEALGRLIENVAVASESSV